MTMGKIDEYAKNAASLGRRIFGPIRSKIGLGANIIGAFRRGNSLSKLTKREKIDYIASLLPVLREAGLSERSLLLLYQIFAVMELPAGDRLKTLWSTLVHPYAPPDGFVPSDENIRFSLATDANRIAALGDPQTTEPLLSVLMQELGITDQQLEFLKSWTAYENTFVVKVGREDMIVGPDAMPVEQLKKASAIGVPLAALYCSGTIGFGAIGITTGLATLGAPLAALGLLNPMTMGIAVLIGMGIGTKKILDAVLPTTDGDRQRASSKKRAQLLARLEDIAKTQKQQVLALLSEDADLLERQVPPAPTELTSTLNQLIATQSAA